VHINATWSKGPHFKLSRVLIPFPLQLFQDKQEVWRIKVLEYSTSRLGERRKSTKLGNNHVSFPSLSTLNLGVFKDQTMIWSQILPPSVAPTVSPTLQPTMRPTRGNVFGCACGLVDGSVVPTGTTDIPVVSSAWCCESQTGTTDIPVVSSAKFLVIGVASLMPFFLTFF